MAGIVVDPDDLRTAAVVVGGAADLLGRARADRAADLVVSGPTGWSVDAMTGTASGAWGLFLGQLRGSVQASSDGLLAMADNFVAAEWQARATQRRGGGAFEE